MRRTIRLASLLVLVALLVSACQLPPPPQVAPSAQAVEVAVPAEAAPAMLPQLPENGAIAETNGIRTYYEIHGQGEPLLFMPGDIRTTEDVADLTDLLATNYQVIVMDARGRGRSSDSGHPMSMAMMADDAVALLDALGIDRAHVVGWASSAVVGMEIAMRYPDRVDKLVLHGPNYTVDGLAADHLAWFKSLAVGDMVPMFEEQYNRTAPDPAHLPVMLARFQELLLREPNYTVEMLGQIQSPTLVIDGELDEWIVREHLETLATAVPNGELVLLPELGHFAPFENPAAWTDAVMAFLARSEDSTAQAVEVAVPAEAAPAMLPQLPENGAIAETNGIRTYYEIHGQGEPLLFMPGDIRTTEDVADLTDLLATNYQVIVMDARGRGRSSDSGQPMTMAMMADDAVALLDQLGIDRAHVVGWASSAAVGMEIAMRYPDRVDKLVLHGPNYTVDGLAADHLAWFQSLAVGDMVPMFEEQYNRTAPDPAHLPVMLARFQELLLREPAFTVEMLGQIQAPTLVIDGDLDEWIVREHLETLAASVPNGELVLLPELGHFAPFENPAAWTDAVMAFLAQSEDSTAQAMPELTVPRLEPTECKYPVLAEANAECSYLIVPEDRSKSDSPTIRILVIKFFSTSTDPGPDPLIVIPGGPGSSGPFYAWMVSALPFGEVMRQDRDVYVLETRGAMSSQPAFYCTETETEFAQLVDKSMAEEQAWDGDAYRACHDRYVAEGANFSHYGFLDIAGDVADLRLALGVEEVNVYGVSYGTTPAMLLMREQPDGIRSVVLDSVIPPDVIYIEAVLGNLSASFGKIFAGCAADPACNAAYPDLAAVFSDLLAQLRQEPVTVSVTDDAGQEYAVTVDDVKFVHFAYDSIFIGDGFTTLPASIYAAHEGDLQAPAEVWLGYVGGQHGPATPENGAWAKGMTYSAMCLQDGSTTNLAQATAVYDSVNALPSVRDWGVMHMLGEWHSPCEYWAVTPPQPNSAIEPVASDLPTLLLSGIFDPEAPSAISQTAAKRLSNSFSYDLPAGHGLLFMDCAVDLMAQFLADPTQEPDPACIDEMPMNWVLPE